MPETEPGPTFITLGPEGSDHERAAERYIELQDLGGVAAVSLFEDFETGLERVRTEPGVFLIQCSAHEQANVVNMRYPDEVVMLDVFMGETMELGLLARRDVKQPRSLGLMPATRAYLLDMGEWAELPVKEEISKPVVAENLLAGQYDAGITTVETADTNPEILRVVKSFGEVMTSWGVYGTSELALPKGTLVGQARPELFTGTA